jgi:hypothetical protein
MHACTQAKLQACLLDIYNQKSSCRKHPRAYHVYV